VLLCDYIAALTDWLEPYHNHIRPSPAAVLAEVTKYTGSKALKAAEPAPQNGQATNGQAKKDDEALVVREAPGTVSKFFDGIAQVDEDLKYCPNLQCSDMNVQFKDILDRKCLLSEALHVVTLTQEVYTHL
jgi:N-terminal acetyltransferase B complex non-catalytic subunit